MSVYYQDGDVTLHHGECIAIMAGLPDNSIDAIVTDPPYGLGFMGKAWDALPPGEEWARECLRVLKPGGHVLAFGGTRTWHRLAVAIEDAGFELRDSIAWLYGSGFPKSLDVSKAIDKGEGIWRGKATAVESANGSMSGGNYGRTDKGEPVTPDAVKWAGWGTALKPAFEPVVVGRKPLVGTVAANVLQHGVGALNIDACRVGDTGGTSSIGEPNHLNVVYGAGMGGLAAVPLNAGRWPANVALDGDQAAALDEQTGNLSVNAPARWVGGTGATEGWGNVGKAEPGQIRGGYGDTGGASRFFPTFRYQAKAPSKERPKVDGVAHPTVKPLDLMRWLVRLVTPPGGTVLEPFLGSGTTAEACRLEGFHCIGIERDETYLPLTLARLGVRRREDIPPWELDDAA